MLGNFTYHNPTKLIFGKDALASLAAELAPYSTIQLVYGSGSIRRFGIYNQVIETLRAEGKTIVEDSGVMPNPTIEKLREGAQIARDNDVDFILAVGGGSCVDYAKAVAVSKDLPVGEDPGTCTSTASRVPRRIERSCPWDRFSLWWALALR